MSDQLLASGQGVALYGKGGTLTSSVVKNFRLLCWLAFELRIEGRKPTPVIIIPSRIISVLIPHRLLLLL